MILIGLIITTLLYYFVLVKLNGHRKAAFKVMALDVIGSTAASPETIKGTVFGATNHSTTTETISPNKVPTDLLHGDKDQSLKDSIDTAALTREAIFNNSTMDDTLSVEQKELQRQSLLKELDTTSTKEATINNGTASETTGESISDFTTKEELEQIVSELGYNDTPNSEPDLIEEIDATQLLEFFQDYKALYQQEAQEIIDYNTKRTVY